MNKKQDTRSEGDYCLEIEESPVDYGRHKFD